MATITTVRARFLYQYAAKDWRKDAAESYQKAVQTETEYTVVDGQIVRQVDTTWNFASAVAEVASNPVTGPPYFYADGNYYADPAFIFQKTHIKTITYEEFSDTSYEVTIDDYDVLLNKHTISHQTIDGKMPLAQTIGSALSSLTQRPLSGTLEDDCDFVDATQVLSVAWAENADELSRVARRQMQRNTAIVRRIKMRANPLMKLCRTVRIKATNRLLDGNHIVTERAITHDLATGGSDALVTFEFWTR